TFFIENPGALAPTWSQVSSKPSTFPPSPHTHPIDELATVGGTASALTFLRGDGEWAEPAGGGGGEEYAPATRTHISMADEMLPATPVLSSGNPLTFEFIANGVGPREGHDYVTIQYQDTEVPEGTVVVFSIVQAPGAEAFRIVMASDPFSPIFGLPANPTAGSV